MISSSEAAISSNLGALAESMVRAAWAFAKIAVSVSVRVHAPGHRTVPRPAIRACRLSHFRPLQFSFSSGLPCEWLFGGDAYVLTTAPTALRLVARLA